MGTKQRNISLARNNRAGYLSARQLLRRTAQGDPGFGSIIFKQHPHPSKFRQSAAGNRFWRSIASSSDGSKLAAAAWGDGGIFTSSNYGASWIRQSAAGNRFWFSIASSSDGSRLAAVASGVSISTYPESGSRARWIERSNTGFHWRAIASSSYGKRLAAAADNGGIYTSSDYGASWTNRSEAGNAQSNPIFGDKAWRSIASSRSATSNELTSEDGKWLAAAANNGGIFTSSDYGASWTDRSEAGNAQSNPIFGDKAWRSIASSSDGRRLAAVVEGGGIYTGVFQ